MKGTILSRKAAAAARNVLDFFGRARVITVYALVILLTLSLWSASLILSDRIARDALKNEYTAYSDDLFEQTVANLDRGINDLVQLSYTVMYSPNFNTFLKTETFSERNEALKEIDFEFNRLKTIQNDIKGIKLYNDKGVLTASTGIEDGRPPAMDSGIQFYGSGTSSTGVSWFGLSFPVYSVTNAKVDGLTGYCTLQIDLSFLKDRLPENGDAGGAWSVILDDSGGILLEKGIKPETAVVYAGTSDISPQQTKDQIIYRRELPRTGWQVVFGVPDSDVVVSFNSLRRIYLLTYISTGILIILLLISIYASFLRPMNRQIRFMNYYAVNRKSRMEVRAHNEMGMLAENLNAMLDDIDRLNEENLAASKRVLEAEYQKKQSELLAYRNQINPHFLYNTFECIRGMALYYDVPDIAAISEALARFFTYNVRGKGYASIHEIKEHVDDYAAIIGYRFMSKYQVSCSVQEEAEDCVFPKMVIQPLVENAIFHGLEPADRPGTVKVEVALKSGVDGSGEEGQKKKLCVSVADDGTGMDETKLKGLRMKLSEYDRTNLLPVEKHGIGMVNLYRRLRVFYGEELRFTISSEIDRGTEITILVPAEISMTGDENVPGFFN